MQHAGRTPEPLGRLRDAVATVVVGKREVVDLLLVALLCRGHVLLEDVPGVGKTLLARSLATAMGCGFRRVQFTPDVLPSDVTGSSVFDQRTADFDFRPGPVFTPVLLADEINRATPRTQSALLEAMEERQVTVDGRTLPLPEPFLVMATQNPVELEGTFPLPEAQLDRFLVRVAPGYPSVEEEDEMLQRFGREDPASRLSAVTSPAEIVSLQTARGEIVVGDAVRAYLLDVVRATRADDRLALGASPRGALALHRAVQARALLDGRAFALPDDVKQLVQPVLAHRLLLAAPARLRGEGPERVLGDLLERVPVPVEHEVTG
ncbi:MAG TPA: MoxR family ATPase [Acidimicrobiales bacterium]|nr:MoxR family ATPase [Acidimicrobiales bacterium]